VHIIWGARLAWCVVGKSSKKCKGRFNTSTIPGQDAMIERSAASPGLVRSAHKCQNTKILVSRAICKKMNEFCGRFGALFVGRQRMPFL
jgi:acyl CoA:acetate/3-ketoacid CoA transferase beta subunit